MVPHIKASAQNVRSVLLSPGFSILRKKATPTPIAPPWPPHGWIMRGLSQANADRTVTEWTATFERLQADLEALKEAAVTKVREAADTAASALSIFSMCAFVGFFLRAFAVTWGGHIGAKCATSCDKETGDCLSEHEHDASDIRMKRLVPEQVLSEQRKWGAGSFQNAINVVLGWARREGGQRKLTLEIARPDDW